ncbi:hypothetical protein IT568_09360 [bacterium]|nr:hypothetical protein [bacterium]
MLKKIKFASAICGCLLSVSCFASDLLVEVHEEKEGNKLWYRVGTVETSAVDIVWGENKNYTSGKSPVIAVSGNIAVSVHQGYDNDDLYATVGIINPSTKSIEWGQAIRFIKKGNRASVTLKDKNVVVAYQVTDSHSLQYIVGTLEIENRKIVFGAEKKFDTGKSPSISIEKLDKVK